MKHIQRWTLFVSFLAAAGWVLGPRVRAQEPSGTLSCTSTSFTQLLSDSGAPLSFTIPLHYGSFADVEIGSASSGTVQLEADVFEDSTIRDRRVWILLPGRVVLLSEVLGVENLFEIGSPLVVRLETSAPVSAFLVRRD